MLAYDDGAPAQEEEVHREPRNGSSRGARAQTACHLYLANALLERGSLERAMELAKRGITLGVEPSLAPFGHFILADVYQRMGRPEDAAREMAIAQRLHNGGSVP